MLVLQRQLESARLELAPPERPIVT